MNAILSNCLLYFFLSIEDVSYCMYVFGDKFLEPKRIYQFLCIIGSMLKVLSVVCCSFFTRLVKKRQLDS